MVRTLEQGITTVTVLFKCLESILTTYLLKFRIHFSWLSYDYKSCSNKIPTSETCYSSHIKSKISSMSHHMFCSFNMKKSVFLSSVFSCLGMISRTYFWVSNKSTVILSTTDSFNVPFFTIWLSVIFLIVYK